MHTKDYDGKETLTDAKDLTQEKAIEALNNRYNQVVAFHGPGSVITMSDGRSYTVDKNGSWRRNAQR